MDIVLTVIFSILSIITGYVLKKIKKKEVLTTSSKYYYLSIVLLTAITIFIQIPLLKKCFLFLTIAPLIYQMFLDFETFELSDELSGYVFVLGLIYTLITKQHVHFVTMIILLAIYTVMSLLGPMGFGDVKLIAGLGLFLYRYGSLLFYPFLFAVIGELITRIFIKRESSEFAFGPYIILGFYVAMFFLERTI